MYFFIGIKGAGMSSLAQMMKQLGYEVSGSDKSEHFFTQIGLEKLNIPFYKYNKDNIKKEMIIIRGESIKDDHEEIARAKKLNLKIITYIQMVGKLTHDFDTIAIAGCHGKTTTTSMMAHILNNLGGCNYLIGDGRGYADENNRTFVLEACEYKRHFLAYDKEIAIITNIDFDHVDYFKDIEDVIDAYQEFINNTRKYIIACGEDPYTGRLNSDKIKYYGFDDKFDIVAKNIAYKNDGTAFDLFIEDKLYGHFDIPIFGQELLLDAIAVIATSYYLKIENDKVNQEFQTFNGAQRRFSQTIVNDSVVIDDYAHHPNEIKALLSAIKQKYNKKIIGIFQPHTYSRTKEFMNDFVDVFKNIDKVYILDIHEAREKSSDFPGITSEVLINKLDNGFYLKKDECSKIIEKEPCVYVIMSPNDLSVINEGIINALKN